MPIESMSVEKFDVTIKSPFTFGDLEKIKKDLEAAGYTIGPIHGFVNPAEGKAGVYFTVSAPSALEQLANVLQIATPPAAT